MTNPPEIFALNVRKAPLRLDPARCFPSPIYFQLLTLIPYSRNSYMHIIPHSAGCKQQIHDKNSIFMQ